METDTFERRPTAVAAPQQDIAQHFAALLAGFDDPVLRIRLIHDSDKTQPAIEREGTIAALWPEVIDCQARGYGVFYLLNEVALGDRGQVGFVADRDVTKIRALATDHDEGLPDIWEWHMTPRVVVRTSLSDEVQRGQAIWPVVELPASDFKKAQLRLARHYGSDRAISNPSRVLRLPGTLHQKNPSAPQLVTFEDFGSVWDASRSPLEGLPETASDEARKISSATGNPVSLDHLRDLLGYIDPDTDRSSWRDIVAATRATPVEADGDEAQRRQLAIAFSRGELDRLERWSSSAPSRYSGDDDVNKVFDSMPPRAGGVGYGTLYAAARAGGFEGPPFRQTASETFAGLSGAGNAGASTAIDRALPFLLTEADIFAWPDPEELIPGLLMRGENVCLFGAPKVGKTFIALDIALSIAAGRSVFGHIRPKVCGSVVYLSGEGHAGMKRRVKAWRQSRGVQAGETLPFYYKANVPNTSAGAGECERYVEGILGQLERGPVLVVIDTMARSMSGLNENDAGDVGRYLALTEDLRSRLDCTVLTLAHSGKDETKGIRGSNASTAGFDAIWGAEMNAANRTVKVEAKWLKDADELGPFCFRLKPIDVAGMSNGKGAVLEYVPVADFRSADDARDPLSRNNVATALQGLGAINVENAVTTTVLAEVLTARVEGETVGKRRANMSLTGKNLSRRISGRCQPSLALDAFAHKGEGPGGATMWHIPDPTRRSDVNNASRVAA